MKFYKLMLSGVLTLGVLTLLFFGCQKDAKKNPTVTSDAKGGSQSTNVFDPVTLSCAGSSTQTSIALTVTAGASGAPAGFSIQWMTKAQFDAIGGVWPADTSATTYCKASFSGVPYGSKNPAQAGVNSYNLGANGSVTVYIGDLLNDELNQQLGLSTTVCDDGILQCGTQYVFRAFAHGNSTKNRSAFSFLTNPCATTDPCGVCGHHGFGYWKQHPELVTDLTLGDHAYTATQISSILNQSPNGNGLVILAHQLIADKLNGLCSDVTSTADAAFNGKVVPPVGTSTVTPNTFAGLIATLHKHNNGCLECAVVTN